MKNKKGWLIFGVVAGWLVNFIGMLSGTEYGGSTRNISGVLIFGGGGMFALCINRLQRLSYEKEFPDLVRKEEIERRDERNTQIRNRAKAKSADIIQWFILLTAGLIYFSDGPWWPAVVLVGVYFLRSGIEWYYIQKYQKEM